MRLLTAAHALAALIVLPLAASAQEAPPEPENWDAVVEAAQGSRVFWHAWGGDPRINDFIEWVGDELDARHDIDLTHVKLSDTAEAVSRVVAEASAGQDSGGAVDAIWINGANFAQMKENDLLFGPFADDLPNWRYIDTAEHPAITVDFTEPVDGLGAPWALFRMVFEYDSAAVPEPPRDVDALRAWITENPGRFTYPQPPDYLGTSFLKQILYGLVDDPQVLMQPADDADYDAVTEPLWAWLDAVTPDLWRSGRAYPQNEPALGQLLADGEIDIAFSFNPGRASAAIADFELPDTVRTYVFERGTIGNASFISIPYNAANPAGAMVLANFIMSPQAQARAQNPQVLGFQTVLDLDRLPADERARFEALDLGIATLRPEEMGATLPEPHPSWMTRIAQDWQERYGVAE
ncbi:ABC transporter substrate-binding protein [Rhodobacteraceae bacterium WD3A24]|nr:ABC transporter substrate-binding protein [Rhodobacteraceae bacterium WD3A24]